MSNRKYRSRAEWQALIEQQSQSVLSVVEFCKQFDLSPKYFYRKRRQLRDAKALVPADNPFVQVTPAPLAESVAGDNLELQYRESRLQMPVLTDPAWLAQLLQAL